MNSEGYRTPTEDKAIGNETRREKLRKKHKIREGDIIKMKIEIRPDKAKEETVTKKSESQNQRDTCTSCHSRISLGSDRKLHLVGF